MLIPGKENLGPIKGYKDPSFLSKGGHGDVYLARHEASGLMVGIMAIPLQDWERYYPDKKMAEFSGPRFHHKNILRLIEYGQNGAFFVRAFEHIEGSFLNTYLKKHGSFTLPIAAQVAVQVADALNVIHDQGYAYLNLRTDRLTLTSSGRVVLDDFGMMRAFSGVNGPEPAAINELAYSPPESVEQLNPYADPQLDLYALAVIFYEMLAGAVPFETRSSRKLIQSIFNDMPPKLSQRHPDLPSSLDAFFEQALAKDRNDRFPNAQAMKNALLALEQNPG